MAVQARQVADNASFQAFVNAYLREVQSGVWHSVAQWQRCCGLQPDLATEYITELQLVNTGHSLAVGVAYRSQVGRHRLTGCYQLQPGSIDWQPLDSISAIMLLIQEIYAQPQRRAAVSEQQLELTARTLESHQIMTQYLQARFDDQLLDQQDATEFRIKARLYQLFEQWCGIHQLGFAAKAAGSAEVSL